MTEEKYEDKIKEMLGKVTKGEQVFNPVIEDKTAKKIKEKGVKTAILEVFNESVEVPRFITNEENNEETDQYVTVNPPSSYKDCDDYWITLDPYFKRLGSITPHSDHSGVKEITVDGKPMVVRLIRDTKNADKPSIMFQSDLQSDKIIGLVEKTGLKVNRLSAKNEGKNFIIDLIP